jgi:hypothetical protein
MNTFLFKIEKKVDLPGLYTHPELPAFILTKINQLRTSPIPVFEIRGEFLVRPNEIQNEKGETVIKTIKGHEQLFCFIHTCKRYGKVVR